MRYRIGWPFWKFFYKLGFTLTYAVQIGRVPVDPEFQNENKSLYCYCGYFPDIGLHIETETFEEFLQEVHNVIEDYVEVETNRTPKSRDLCMLPYSFISAAEAARFSLTHY